jgi:DNA ligase-3
LSGLADSADLIVLGAYFGTGNYGGILSVFLCGVYDKKEKVFLTVCKVYFPHRFLSCFVLSYRGARSVCELMRESVFLSFYLSFDYLIIFLKIIYKIGNGFDEKTIHGFQDTMKQKMVKIEKDFSRVPDWLRIHRALVPDYVAKDPKAMPVFEVAGAEFTESPVNTLSPSLPFSSPLCLALSIGIRCKRFEGVILPSLPSTFLHALLIFYS